MKMRAPLHMAYGETIEEALGAGGTFHGAEAGYGQGLAGVGTRQGLSPTGKCPFRWNATPA